ncbi:MAG: type II secretion system protein, partial [Thermoguttaceae bacterium]
MTLVELLVVLTILAILSAVAVFSTETVVRQGRFEATQRTLRAVEEAVLGPEAFRAEDGNLSTSGFVADIGRLPVDLAELWSPGGLPAFA